MDRPTPFGQSPRVRPEGTAITPEVGASERWIAGLLGGFLLLSGLRSGIRGTLLGVGAGLLLARAASGGRAPKPAQTSPFRRYEGGIGAARPTGDGARTYRVEQEASPYRDVVQEASEESFPASDPPAFTSTVIGPPEHH